MKITIDVKRAEQSFDLDRMVQQNYLVVEFAGQEIKLPCSEDQLATAISECMGATGMALEAAREDHVHPVVAAPVPATTSREFNYVPDPEPEQEEKPVSAAPAVFVVPEPRPAPVPKVVAQQPATSLRPVARPPVRQSDDAGISQG